ncbi:inosine-uridine preferring nucleoside hydrolase-like [Anopheles nili]|uniref:inosine-uridine preferring nucleoside hydrolase-like n=1 Tax=Anopheles nili TaxID=185578 RepID=UPI00237B41C2|nr:inosine-uridine preferring nucleoside hydrolase-like [Anopheles nili]
MDVKKVIIDVDVGTDDAWALVLLLNGEARYNYKVVAITCVHGNTNVDNVVSNTLSLLSVMGRTDVPVFKGVDEPLLPPAVPHVGGNFHGENGFGDIQFDHEVNRAPLQEEHAVSAICRLVEEHAGNIDLLFVGPLTNLALCLKIKPQVFDQLSHLYIMGGNRKGIGNVTAAAEFNFHSDPEAACIVLRKIHRPITIMPWETCVSQSEQLPMAWRMKDLGAGDLSPRAVALLALLDAIEQKVYGDRPRWMPCDAFLVAAYQKPPCAKYDALCPVDVELQGALTRGQMVLNRSKSGTGNVHVIRDLEDGAFKELCRSALDDLSSN